MVGFLYQPLVAWGPLLAAVTVSYHRRHSGLESCRRRCPWHIGDGVHGAGSPGREFSPVEPGRGGTPTWIT